MKKNLLLIIILFLLCGCSVEYEIELNDVLKLNENIKIIPSTVEEENSLASYNTYLPVDFDIDERGAFENKYDDLEYYNYKLNSNNAMNIKYSHNIEDFGSSRFINSCYEYVTVMQDSVKNEVLLSTSNQFKCFDYYDNLEDVKVKIHSNYKLIETNADYVEDNYYIWDITRENKNNKYIYLSLDMNEKDEGLLRKVLGGSSVTIFIVFSVTVISIGLLIYFLKKKGDFNNRI